MTALHVAVLLWALEMAAVLVAFIWFELNEWLWRRRLRRDAAAAVDSMDFRRVFSGALDRYEEERREREDAELDWRKRT